MYKPQETVWNGHIKMEKVHTTENKEWEPSERLLNPGIEIKKQLCSIQKLKSLSLKCLEMKK